MRRRCGAASRGWERDRGRERGRGSGRGTREPGGAAAAGPLCRSGPAARSEVLAEAVSCLNRALSALGDIWEEIGIPEELRVERTGAVKKHVKNLLDMMVAEEEHLKEQLLRSVAAYRKELDSLCAELQAEPFQVRDTEQGSTILQMMKDLHTRVEALLKQKKDRKRELKALQEQDKNLCDILCVSNFSIDDSAVPSLDELERYRRHVAFLSAEKERRQEEFVSIKRQVILCMAELEHSPDTSFERDVVCEDEEAFCLSTDNIANLQSLLQQVRWHPELALL
ncbi:hypothetical protein CIB84_002445 [Bambusicola thoracicus]|uniref:Protein regulator of cytokinesis 1 n=1 Tax=Bambusicola thoracicus TaxID=9083 RepID=A0A2P4TBR4_BAMTH|nr:hypothetical protein CIB84_002445 [Bambusicola thoracicus]